MEDSDFPRPKVRNQVLLGLIYCILIMLPLISAIPSAAWGRQEMIVKVGNTLILLTFSVLALQPVLAARLKLLDRQFGLDGVYVFHKTMGMTAGAMQLSGVGFLMVAPGWPISLPGWTGAVLLLVLVLTALLYRELRMSYETWRILHNILFIAVFITVFFQVWSFSGIMGSPITQVLTSVFFVIATAAYLNHRIIGPSNRRKHLYRIQSVKQETQSVWTLTLSPSEGVARFLFRPGQFQFLTFGGGRGEEHPFTISSSPAETMYHTATIKESGDFTRRIGTLKPGDSIAIQAPFGLFSHEMHPDENELIFIAGGIGITPFMSMLRHMRDTKADKEVLLVYGNHTEKDMVFRDELDAIAANGPPRLRVIHVLSRAGDTWRGDRGRIDRTIIEKYMAGDLLKKSFYVCGPPSMMTTVIAMLIDRGVPSSRIRSERFVL